VTTPQEQTEKWKSTLDWYKQLMTVNGVAGVAIAAFLTFAGRTGSTVKPPTVAVAYVAIFIFLLSVGFAVRAMFRVINYVEPKGVGEFLKNLPWLLSPFLYSAIGFLVFLVAVALHVWSLFISAV
jgi:hypothetical protein